MQVAECTAKRWNMLMNINGLLQAKIAKCCSSLRMRKDAYLKEAVKMYNLKWYYSSAPDPWALILYMFVYMKINKWNIFKPTCRDTDTFDREATLQNFLRLPSERGLL